MLVPPDNFGLVEPGVYRCSKLEAGHLPFLETLQLKSLVVLDAAKPPRTLRSFLDDNNVELFNLGAMKISNHQNTESSSSKTSVSDSDGVDAGGSHHRNEIDLVVLDTKKRNDLWMIIEKNLIVAAFEILFDKSNHNLLLVDLSLTLVGILRKIQKWNFNSIVNEYRIYTGNASKNNYNMEVFLELVETELVPCEVDAAIKRRDEVVQDAHSKPMRGLVLRASLDEGHGTGDEEESIFFDDYEEDVDDDVLSASPQIPANLLKLVELRKLDDKPSPGTSPDQHGGHPGVSRNGSLDKLSFYHRRKSSADSRYLQKNNTRFRNPSFSQPKSPQHRGLFESHWRNFRFDKERLAQEELQKLKEKFNYKYYKLNTNSLHVPGLDVIRLRLPSESNLPEWFLRGRDYWESTRVVLRDSGSIKMMQI